MILLRLISWPYFRKHVLRTMLTVAGIVLGVAVFVGMHTANQSVLFAFASTVDRIAGKTELQVTAGETGFEEDVLEKVHQTLAAGNRVWFVGGIKLPPEGRAPRSLPPAPNAYAGWDNVAYSDSWMEQLGVFVRNHSEHGQTVTLPSTGAVNSFEDVPLVMVDGWQ